MTDVDLEPDADEVMQVEPVPPLGTVPVCLVDAPAPVRVQQLPAKAGGTRTVTLDAVTPRQVLGADHFRSRFILTSFDQDFRYCFSKSSSQDAPAMSRHPKGIPLDLSAVVEVWVIAASGTTEFSYTTLKWATGDPDNDA